MNYTFMPSLEHRALIKTVITLWNPPNDIEWSHKELIKEDHVIGKVKQLPLPESLKKKILGFIKPIGFEICLWIYRYHNYLDSERGVCSMKRSLDIQKQVGKSLSKLCWTSQGAVDRKKTAEELIRDETLDITDRYKLACMHCLKDDILMLWNKMPEDCRKSFYSEENPLLVNQHILITFWTYHIKGELTRMNYIFEMKRLGCTPYEYALDIAIECENKVATEYFWQNLNSEERERMVEIGIVESMSVIRQKVDVYEILYDSYDILFFLLLQMNEEQQLEVLKKYPCEILNCMLNWSRQDFFMETANHVWAFLRGDDYYALLRKIIDKVKDGYKDYDYKKLFAECWQQCPVTRKKYVTDEWMHGIFLSKLFKVEDGEYFKIIFPSTSDREKLLFSDKGKRLFESLIIDDKMHLVEVFVRECRSSKDVIMKLREEFLDHEIHNRSTMKKLEGKKDELRKFFNLLDELILEDDNRKHVDEGNTDPPAKRFCTHNK